MKRVNVYYIVDTSAGMNGAIIGTVNASLENCIPWYKEIEKLTGASIYLKLMQYSTSANWVNDCPVELDDIIWNDLQASGIAGFGEALKLLKEEFRELDKDIYPVIIHLAYCSPIDDWESIVEQLEEVDSYNRALRIVVNIEGAFDEDVAFRFTNDFNNIVAASREAELKRMIVNGIKNYFYNQDVNCLDLSITESNSYCKFSTVLNTYGIKVIRDIFSDKFIELIEDNNISRSDYEKIQLLVKELTQIGCLNNKKHQGKIKCEKLKEIRVKIARENGIKYVPNICNHEGPCLGTCPACDKEIQYLNEQLQAKKDRGEEIILKGIAAADIEIVASNGLSNVADNETEEIVMGRVEVDTESVDGTWGVWD